MSATSTAAAYQLDIASETDKLNARISKVHQQQIELGECFLRKLNDLLQTARIVIAENFLQRFREAIEDVIVHYSKQFRLEFRLTQIRHEERKAQKAQRAQQDAPGLVTEKQLQAAIAKNMASNQQGNGQGRRNDQPGGRSNTTRANQDGRSGARNENKSNNNNRSGASNNNNNNANANNNRRQQGYAM